MCTLSSYLFHQYILRMKLWPLYDKMENISATKQQNWPLPEELAHTRALQSITILTRKSEICTGPSAKFLSSTGRTGTQTCPPHYSRSHRPGRRIPHIAPCSCPVHSAGLHSNCRDLPQCLPINSR